MGAEKQVNLGGCYLIEHKRIQLCLGRGMHSAAVLLLHLLNSPCRSEWTEKCILCSNSDHVILAILKELKFTKKNIFLQESTAAHKLIVNVLLNHDTQLRFCLCQHLLLYNTAKSTTVVISVISCSNCVRV